MSFQDLEVGFRSFVTVRNSAVADFDYDDTAGSTDDILIWRLANAERSRGITQPQFLLIDNTAPC
jgi:hypothetical protein